MTRLRSFTDLRNVVPTRLPEKRPLVPEDRVLVDDWLFHHWPAVFGILFLPIDPEEVPKVKQVAEVEGQPGWAIGLIGARAASRNTHFKTMVEASREDSKWHSLRGAHVRSLTDDERQVLKAEVERLREKRGK